MHKLLTTITLFLFLASLMSGQSLPCSEPPFIRDLRVYGGDDERNLPVFVRPDTARRSGGSGLPPYITIRFDVDEQAPPRLKLIFRHCDKDWNIDTDYFVRDDFFTYTRMLFYEASPGGSRGYSWRFENRFPSEEHPFVRFLYSGNWIVDIVDEQDDDAIYASARFICVEDIVPGSLRVFNDYWTEWDMPLDQVHRLQLAMKIPDVLFADYLTTVDFYKNFNLFDSYRVGSYDFSRNTFVEGIGLREKTFIYRNILPGNGYRVFDFTRPGVYPSGNIVSRFGGPDFTRYRFSTELSAHYGAAVTLPLRSWDSEYLCVRFELEHPRIRGGDVFVAGIFNSWDPQEADKMEFDEDIEHYVHHRWLLRGSYDYQYVIGVYDDEAGYVREADWTFVEGNSWAARNLYWCIMYYDDDQFGGVTRAVGFARAVSGQ